jgi:hypothetical protein
MARNDDFFLERWIMYYGTQLGFENLYIILDGTDQKKPKLTDKATIIVIEKTPGKVAEADKRRIDIISKFTVDLFQKYDLVIGTDADEFLLVDPNCNKTLAEYLSGLSIKNSVSGLGLDVGQKKGTEQALDYNKPFLLQREYALVSSRYTKASVLSKPLKWGAGFHRVRNHNFRIDKNLYLFHFGCVDLQIIESKLKNNDMLEGGWERHLRKRTKTITYISTKKARNAHKIIPLARLIQTFFRPLYAWNKPSMCSLKLVIRIPESFRKSPLC